MRKALFLLAIALLTISTFAQNTTEGTLYAVDKKGTNLGACPLKNTAVRADISGFLARVYVKQEFVNSYSEPIEAIYTFPLSQNGAVDDMTMTVGTRVIRGKILKREQARQVYEDAKTAGKAASLLDQERSNIFTQAVANIMPGEKVIIEISYVETLKYEDGAYEFVFPMTVGPRYIPGSVTDAARIRPPVAESRPAHDISVEVNLNAGVPVESIRSTSHSIEQLNLTTGKATVALRGEKTIPNKDFILRYDVTGKRLEDGVLAHRDARGGFFTLMLQPPDTVAAEDRTPKEIVFVLDTSGSMSGFPIEKAKEAMRLSLDGLYPEDTFNLITFAGDTSILFDKPVHATQANLERAQAFLAGREGGGGTEMMKAIKASLDPSDSQEHLRIVCFMTDAFIGNDDEIIAEIQKHPKARIFSFGIGSSVNRSFLDKMAEAGKGEVEIVTLDDDGSKAAKRFYERVRTPMLTDLSIDWNGMPVADIHPNKLSDLFSAKPVIVNGRYTKGASGTIKLRGKVAGQPYERSINLALPEKEEANDVLATLWARRRVDELSMQALKGGPNAEAANKQIEGLGLEYRILTSFTSFVAVEEQIVNQNGTPTKVEVPIAIPEGVNREVSIADTQETLMGTSSNPHGSIVSATVGRRKTKQAVENSPANITSLSLGSGSGRGTGSGSGSGTGSGTGNGNAPGPVSATVEVTAGDSTINSSQTAVSTTISRRTVEELPKGTTFSSLLTLLPGATSQSLNGGFSVDGASGSENTFIIDGSEVTNFRNAGKNSRPRIEGRALAVAEPVYPDEAKTKKVLGTVEVVISVDPTGTIVSAKAISGSSLLREASEAAAMLSKFAPAYANGRRMRLSGTFVYDFKSSFKVSVFLRKMKAEALTEDDKKTLSLSEKLNARIYAVAVRVKNSDATPSPNESTFVVDGKASVRILIRSRNPSVLAKLKRVGFTIDPGQKTLTLSGLIPIEKLAALAEIDEVSYVMPKD